MYRNLRLPLIIFFFAGLFRFSVSQGAVYAWGDNTFGESNAGPALAVSAGGIHSLALLKFNGKVVAWGSNENGEDNVPPGLTNCIAVAAGYLHSTAVRANGTVVAWGDNTYSQLNVPPGLASVKAVSSGYLHTLALRSNGTVASWGDNSAGQCSVPLGLAGVTAVAAGAYHSLVLRNIGTVLVWGDNSVGQRNVPGNLTSVVAIAAGAYHNLALRANGSVVAWGDDTYGQIDVPAGLSNVVGIAAGERFSLALKADGTVVGWGDNQFGELKIPATLNNAIAISAGAFHALALTDNGEVVGWGGNYRGESGTPPGLGHYRSISAGKGFNLAAQLDGGAVGWGDQSDGKCNVPLSPYRYTAVSAGYRHSLGFVTYKLGGVTAWGDNSFGQCSVPAIAAGQVSFSFVPQMMSAGGYHSLALITSAGGSELQAWGDNSYGQCAIPPYLAPDAISAGGYHSLALAQGSVNAWGRNDSGQCNVPPDLNSAIAVAAGGFHSIALLADHTVVAWGDNSYGQCNVPAGLTGVVAVAAGGYHSLALKSDGTVVAWGRNDSGQCDVPAGLSGIGAIAAGFNHSLALSAVPRAFNKSFDADASKTLVIAAPGVLVEDFNPGKALRVASPSHGYLNLATDGSFTYLPSPGFTGIDSFTYKDVSAMGESHQATVIVAVYEHLQTCTVSPTNVVGGTGSTGTVLLQIPPRTSDRYVHLASDNKSVVVPIYAYVPMGIRVGHFPITTHPVDVTQAVHITASLATSTAVAVLIVKAPSVVNFAFQKSTIVAGTGTNGVLTLDGRAGPSGMTFTLSEDNPAVVIPASFVVAANQNAKSFAVTSKGVAQTTIVNIKATLGTFQVTAPLMVTPASLDSVNLVPRSVVAGGSVAGTVVLNGKQGPPVGVVYLQSDNPAAPVPGYVLLLTDQTNAAFTFNTIGVDSTQTATIKGTLNGLSKSAVLTVNPATIAMLTLSANPVTGGASLVGTVSLSGLAGASGLTVTLHFSDPAVKVPLTIVLPQNTKSKTFSITTQSVAAAKNATIVASASGRGTAYQVLKINP